MRIIIDLLGDEDDVIVAQKTHDDAKNSKNNKKIKDWLKITNQTQLEIVKIDNKSSK